MRGRSQVVPHPENFPASPFRFAWTDNDDKAGQLIAVSRSWFFTSVPRRWVFSPFLLTDAVRHTQTTADRAGRGAYCCDSHTFLPKCSATPSKRANFLLLVKRLRTGTVKQSDTRKTSELRSILEEEQRIWTFLRTCKETKASFRQREDAGAEEELAQFPSRLFLRLV